MTDPPAPDIRAGTVPAALARRRRVLAVGAAVAACAGLLYLAGHDPHDPAIPMPLCPVRHLTGLDCPACGSLRAVHSLLHGHLRAAGGDNAFALACAPLLTALLARQGRAVWQGRYAPVPAPLAYGLGIAAVAWMAVRNLSG